MDKADIAAVVVDFLRERCFGPDEEIDPDLDLFWSGRLSSFELIEMLLFIESRLGLSFDPMLITVERMGSLTRIADFISEIPRSR